MAPNEEFYFPSLDKCLSGEQQLLSWKATFEALCNPSFAKENTFLQGFLADHAVTTILRRPLKPFDAPSPNTKSDFETRTAAINVTPNGSGGYNINEIKEDARWLSDKAKVDETTALRIVILEWQGRAINTLVEGPQEPGTDVFNGSTSVNLGASAFLPKGSIVGTPTLDVGNSSPQEKRRRKLLRLYTEERVATIRCSEILLRAAADNSQAASNESLSADEKVGCEILAQQQNGGSGFLVQCIDTLNTLLKELDVGSSGWYTDDIIAEVEEAWEKGKLLEIAHIQQILFFHLARFDGICQATLVLQWFNLMQQYGFLAGSQSELEGSATLFEVIRLNITLISLSILKLPAVLALLNSDPTEQLRAASATTLDYLNNADAFNSISNIIVKATDRGPNPASLAAFALTVIQVAIRQVYEVQRTALEGPEPTRSEQALADRLSDMALSDEQMNELAIRAVDMGRPYEVVVDTASKLLAVFSSSVDKSFQNMGRIQLLQLIESTHVLTRYDQPIINATLAVLNKEKSFWASIDSPPSISLDPVLGIFLDEGNSLKAHLFDAAQLRFPYELSPFLRFCRELTADIARDTEGHELLGLLSSVLTYTQALPHGFNAFRPYREEESSDYIQLLADLPIFLSSPQESSISKQLVLSGTNGLHPVLAIPAGTVGFVMSRDVGGNHPAAVTWDHPYNCFTYLTYSLATIIRGSQVFDFATETTISLDTAAEIVGLFNSILAAVVKSSIDDPMGSPVVNLILGNDSEEEESIDLVNIIFELFEQELQAQRERSGAEGLDLLVACVRFFYLLTKIQPARIWPFFSRSRFLQNDGLASVIAGTEMVLGRYELLTASIRLYGALMDEAVTHVVQRKTAGSSNRAVTRFGEPTPGAGSPDKIIGRTLLAFTRICASVMESMGGWRWQNVEESIELSTDILSIFSMLLLYAYGYNDTQSLDKKLTAALADSADHVLNVFGSSSTNDLPITPLLVMLETGSRKVSSTLFVSHEKLWRDQTEFALGFVDTLLRVNLHLNQPTTHLETQLFKAMPVLTKLFAVSDDYKAPVARVLQTLVKSATRSEKEPPSLLGHMGAEGAKAFIGVLSTLGKPLDSLTTELEIWSLLSSAVSGKQQWFAIALLTGKTPRDDVRGGDGSNKSKIGTRSLLTLALDELCKIQELPQKRAIAMLEFLMLAQNNWPWAMSELRTHPRFLMSIMTFVGDLRPEDIQAYTDITLLTANRYRMAALIAELLAMYLHHARQLGNADQVVKDLVPRLGFLKNFAVAPPESASYNIPSYSASLHSNLEKNIVKKFSGVKPTDFKRALFNEQAGGREFYYDVHFAEKLLGFSSSWKSGRDNGFAAEFQRANINLYLVQAQVDVLNSWRMLAIELSSSIQSEPRLVPLMAKVVRDCLEANIGSNLPPTPLFERLGQIRVDFAFVILQKLVEAKCQGDEVRETLSKVWEAIRASGQDFETAFSGNGADYYRTLLKVLFLSLQSHLGPPTTLPGATNAPQNRGFEKPEETDSILLELLSKVVATGFSALSSTLHEDPTSVSPTDFVLLTAILQSILRVPRMAPLHAQIALQFASQNTVQYATALFSWADQLATSTGTRDPIYAELSVLFMLELSSVPAIAESMAVEGVLAQLSAANITSFFRRERGMSPFDEPARMHNIWAKGILPLCLNLLLAVRAPVASEVASFLNQFPGQLSRTANVLAAPTTVGTNRKRVEQITLNMASEIHSLALISLIINQLRESSAFGAEIPQLGLDRSALKEDLEGWVQRRRSLLERVVPGSDRELVMVRQKARDDSKFENRLEEMVVGEFSSAMDCLVSDGGM